MKVLKLFLLKVILYCKLPHWETITGMFSVADGEILRYLLYAKIPIEMFVRHELASRGYDKNHRWCGFDKAEKIWLTDE